FGGRDNSVTKTRPSKPKGRAPGPTAFDPDPLFTIKLKTFPAVGASVERREVNEQIGMERLRTPDGKTLQERKINRTNEVEFVQVILGGGDPQPKGFKRTYRKASDPVNGGVKPLSYQGRTIVFELVGESYQASAVGEPAIPPADLADLARRVTRHDYLQAIL